MQVRRISYIFLLLLAFALSGCINAVPAPGGGESVNRQFFRSPDDLRAHLSRIKQGMSERDVFGTLGIPKDDFLIMNPEEIWHAATLAEVPAPNRRQGEGLRSLTGYKFRYKQVKRQHGLSSPISIQTNEKGYDYEVILIFSNGKIAAAPILAGGLVDGVSSSTIFDYVTPGAALRFAPN